MKNLKIWQKLILLVAVLMLPFLIVTANLLSTVNEQIGFARGELVGLDYALPMLRLSGNLQVHRALADRAARDPAFRSQLDTSTAEVQTDLNSVDDVYAGPTGDAYEKKRWEALTPFASVTVSTSSYAPDALTWALSCLLVPPVRTASGPESWVHE